MCIEISFSNFDHFSTEIVSKSVLETQIWQCLTEHQIPCS